MLLISCKSGMAEPTLRCNVCERPIVSGREACVVYPGLMPEGSLHKVLLVHNECTAIAESQYEGDPEPPGRMSLITYLPRFVSAAAGEDVPLPDRPRAHVAAPRLQAARPPRR
jgi:hypothetical protein